MTRTSPFDDLAAALAVEDGVPETLGARPDVSRRARTGVPEVVYCPGKQTRQIFAILKRLAETEGRAIAARCSQEQAVALTALADTEPFECQYSPDSRMFVLSLPGASRPLTGGRVGVLTAGSSDWAVASEAIGIASEMGCEVETFQDVGVAGLHRLVGPLLALTRSDVDVIVVVAGMDGVLPGVVVGLVDLPVVAVPTSTGYGFGGEGVGALTTMLQSCSPGLAVVNIDNGIGAGAVAGLIANRAARQRAGVIQPEPASTMTARVQQPHPPVKFPQPPPK